VYCFSRDVSKEDWECPEHMKKDLEAFKKIQDVLKRIEVLRGTALTPEEAKTKQDMIDEMISEILNKKSENS
jgi:hypothetical protein